VIGDAWTLVPSGCWCSARTLKRSRTAAPAGAVTTLHRIVIMQQPSQYRAGKRDELIRIARALFNREGFDAVSIDEIMAGVGLTRGGFYSYFASKGELYSQPR
jgi:AcrR family transcriptional regulator